MPKKGNSIIALREAKLGRAVMVSSRLLALLRRAFALALMAVAMAYSSSLRAQDVEDYYARLLEEEVEVLDPVKRPVISAGVGVTHFLGDIRYSGDNPLAASWAGRFNISTLVGRQRQLKLNVFLMYGLVEGQDFERSLVMNTSDLPLSVDEEWYPSTAFQTQFYEILLSVEYNFWHLLGTLKTVKPYISLGAGLFVFIPKANYRNADRDFYHYWDDGTIRMLSQTHPKAHTAQPVKLDRQFETDLKKENLWGLDNIPPVTAVIPIEFGLDFYLTNRISLRAFTSLHYTFSDNVDGFDTRVAKLYDLKASKIHDMFMYTGFAFNFDLFSEAESFTLDRAFADIEGFDYEVFFSDQDSDGIIDLIDECPDTPLGVMVDSVGCPLDSDGDGVPDYLDREPNTPIGHPVNEHGEALDDAGMTLPVGQGEAVLRKDVKLQPVSPTWSRRYSFQGEGIPPKFRSVDLDGDGVISFEEVIRAVDDYFAGQSELEPDDIYELNAFFFSQ